MSVPNDRKYLESHEWHRLEGDVVEIGITQTAADELTDITFVELPEVGTSFDAGDRFGEIESVKATSDLYTGVAGEVVEINEKLSDEPGLVNTEPFEGGWMIRLKVADPGVMESDKLLSAEDYEKRI